MNKKFIPILLFCLFLVRCYKTTVVIVSYQFKNKSEIMEETNRKMKEKEEEELNKLKKTTS